MSSTPIHSHTTSPISGSSASRPSAEQANTLEQAQQENAGLQTALEASRQENVLLNDVISTIGSTLKVDEVLSHLVDIIVRAISCQSAFIYLYNKDREQLILASTSEQYQHMVGKIEMGLGEGIIGWVGLTLKPVFLKDEAMHDPRFRYFPGLDEEKFQSTMTVPIIGKERNLIGVIAVQAPAPYEFTEHHQTFVSNTAALVASAIENAQLYENTQRKLSILTSLSILSQTISSGLYLDEMLRSLAMLTMQIMEVDLCVVMLIDQARGRLTVRASSPSLNEHGLNFQPIDIDRNVWEKLRETRETSLHWDAVRGQLPESANVLERLNPLRDTQFKSLLSAPLIAGTDHLGLINCYSNNTRRYTDEDHTLLTTIANQAAMAIKNSHLVDMLAQKNLVKGFLDDLMFGTYDTEDSLRQRATFLGCDLSKPHIVAMIEIAKIDDQAGEKNGNPANGNDTTLNGNGEDDRMALHKRINGLVRRRIQDNFPGSMLHEHENMMTCIICLSKDPAGARLKTWLRDFARQMHSEQHVRLSIGIGNICQSIGDYRRGSAEASEALHMGQTLNRDGGVTHFNDLGVYRYLYKIARMDDLRDMYQEQVARIATYDHRKGTDLLDTLETYLECAGNLTKTSAKLFVHRNTLIQRLERLQSLCDIDLQERANWLTLQVAIKVYKLRAHSS